MSAILDIESSAVVPTVLPGIARIPHPEYSPRVSPDVVCFTATSIQLVALRLSIPDFCFDIDAVVELKQDKSTGQMSIRAAIDTNVELKVAFTGRTTKDGTSLEIEAVSFRL